MTNIIGAPSRNQAADGTLTGLCYLLWDKIAQGTDDMLPAKVIAYDRTTNRAQVQPLIVVIDTNNNQIPRAQIASVPVLQIGGGGFVVSFPLQTGDLGWIKANDRDISLFLQNSYIQAAPNTQRMHSFEDALFIPDSFMKGVVIDGADSGNLVIQKNDGTVKISLGDDKITILAPEIVLQADTSITLDAPITTITGAIESGTYSGYAKTATFHGDITTTGTIIATGNITGQGTSLHTHTHPGVQTGAGNTGAPNP